VKKGFDNFSGFLLFIFTNHPQPQTLSSLSSSLNF
jgi:hypothetical protein